MSDCERNITEMLSRHRFLQPSSPEPSVYTKVFINVKSFVRTGDTNNPRNISSKATPPLATTDPAAVVPDSQIHCIFSYLADVIPCHDVTMR
jgi:hypothetical protein